MRTFFGLAVLVLGSLLVRPVSGQEVKGEGFWESVHSGDRVLDIRIEVSREGWDAMQPPAGRRGRGRAPQGGERRGSRFTYTRARVTIDGQRFEDAGLRYKGNSSFRAGGPRLKKPFKIDLNRFKKGQKLHGRTKLNLSNAFLDPAFMKEKLGYEVYRAAGLPTPGVGWANVTLTIGGVEDPAPLGIYVLVEQVDSRFVADALGKASKGSLLMKPEVDDWHRIDDDPNSYRDYHIKSGEQNTKQLRAFASLIDLIESAPDAVFEREIGERMDLTMFAGYLAATSVLANVDSYISMPHNYYLVMDKADGKLRMLPWDLNEAFGTFTLPGPAQDQVEWDIDRPWVARRRLLERLFETKTFPKLYRAALTGLMDKAFTKERLFERIARFEKILTPHVARSKHVYWLNESTLKSKPIPHLEGLRMTINGDPSGGNPAVRRKTLAIKPFIVKRIASIKAQLAGKSEGKALGR